MWWTYVESLLNMLWFWTHYLNALPSPSFLSSLLLNFCVVDFERLTEAVTVWNPKHFENFAFADWAHYVIHLDMRYAVVIWFQRNNASWSIAVMPYERLPCALRRSHPGKTVPLKWIKNDTNSTGFFVLSQSLEIWKIRPYGTSLPLKPVCLFWLIFGKRCKALWVMIQQCVISEGGSRLVPMKHKGHHAFAGPSTAAPVLSTSFV